jgi:hypothetical protein
MQRVVTLSEHKLTGGKLEVLEPVTSRGEGDGAGLPDPPLLLGIGRIFLFASSVSVARLNPPERSCISQKTKIDGLGIVAIQ